jgi:serine/threonine protein kinase
MGDSPAMSPESYNRVRKLFDEALERPEAERLAFLQAACSDDAEVLAEALRLLEGHNRSGSFLEPAAPLAPQTPPLWRLGRYVIAGEIGRGAMGIVYEATDPAIGRRVALKVIQFAWLADPKQVKFLRERLFKEAQAAGVLHHPGIVTVYDVGQQGEIAYIAMELVEGPPLQQMLAPGLKLRREQALDILRQTAEALDYAHEHNIVHRDVKPSNILLDQGTTVKVGDFGIAKATASRESTHTGVVMGTPSYMSPEQIEGDEVDGRSDQFSLAVVAFELLTGGRPFQWESLAGLAYSIVHRTRPSARTIDETLPQAVDGVLQRALARSGEDRFASCAEFVTALGAALGGASPSAKKASARLPVRYLASAAAALVLVAGFLAYRVLAPTTWRPRAVSTSAKAADRADVSGRLVEDSHQLTRPAELADRAAPAASLSSFAVLDCATQEDSRVRPTSHGTVRVLGGTGSFQRVSEANKAVTVAPRARIDGSVVVRVRNGAPGWQNAPMIWTTSWGNPSDSYRTIMASVMPGEHTLTTPVSAAAPEQAGTYHILFAFDLEYEPGEVASATDWQLHHPVWGDGNDIAEFSAAQIAQAQRYGCAVGELLTSASPGRTGYALVSIPADAITVEVR